MVYSGRKSYNDKLAIYYIVNIIDLYNEFDVEGSLIFLKTVTGI